MDVVKTPIWFENWCTVSDSICTIRAPDQLWFRIHIPHDGDMYYLEVRSSHPRQEKKKNQPISNWHAIMINSNPKQEKNVERSTKKSNLAIKIHFIKANKMWSHYSTQTQPHAYYFFPNRGHAFNSVTLAPPPPLLMLLFQMKFDTIPCSCFSLCFVLLFWGPKYDLFFSFNELVTAAAPAVLMMMGTTTMMMRWRHAEVLWLVCRACVDNRT